MTTISNIKGLVDIQRLPVNSEEHMFYDWNVKFKQSHILHSQCSTPEVCSKQEGKCQFCMYSESLVMPHMPDMVFPNNILSLTHKNGAVIEFNAFDALKTVSNGRLPFKVATAKVWQESRSDTNLEEKVKPFDWTFSTDYKGTLKKLHTEPTEERINLERLKEREKILFYQELTLYEDELHDNGIACCNVKIRVMPSSFFILLRYFLRVDNVMVRVNDTRLFHDFSKDYILREYTSRESGFQELNLPLNMFADANIISPHLPVKVSQYDKITWIE